ncbi:response regulator transcription factor [Terrisporobacter glycolicus]|nr:response regulator transcription factor [Terrisporobacter glycolicus]
MNILVVSGSFFIKESLTTFLCGGNENVKVDCVRRISELDHGDISKVDMLFADLYEEELSNLILIKEKYEHIKMIVYDRSKSSRNFSKIARYNIEGYITEISEKEELIYLLNRVYKNKKYYDLDIMEDMIHNSSEKNYITSKLTNREQEILEKVGVGYTNKEIANRLYISVNTVKKHISNILYKLDMKNRKDLIIYTNE